MIKVGDVFILTSQGVRLKIEHVFAAKPAQPPSYDLPARPAVEASYLVLELDGPTPGAEWTATESFFTTFCTRVQP